MAQDKTTTSDAAEGEAAGADGAPADPRAPSGFGSRLLDQAKRATEQASALATKAGELKDQAADKAGEVKDQVAAKAMELKDAGVDKLLETLEDFNACLPVVREAGYALSSVDIGIGLPPKVVAGFAVAEDVSSEKVEALLTAHADKKLTVLLVRSLFQAWKLQKKIQIGGLKPKGLAVELGIVPTVTVKFA